MISALNILGTEEAISPRPPKTSARASDKRWRHTTHIAVTRPDVYAQMPSRRCCGSARNPACVTEK